MENNEFKKLTADEIIAIIEQAGISVRKFGKFDFDVDEVSILGEINEVERKGGSGQGEEWYSVKHFPLHDVYIKTEGYYSSYNGVTYDEGYGIEVKPVQKTFTVYE